MRHDEEAFIEELSALLSVTKTGFLYKQRGLAYRRLNHFDAALQDFNQAIMVDDDLDSYKFRGEVFLKLGDLEEAEHDLIHFIEHSDPEQDAFALRHLGEVKRLQGDWEPALILFQASLDLDPDNPFAATGVAETLRLQGDDPEALIEFDRVLEQHPEHSGARTGRGWIYLDDGHLEEAMVDFHIALRSDPLNASAEEGFKLALKAHNSRNGIHKATS